MRRIVVAHIFVLLVGFLAASVYLNYQARNEIVSLRGTINDQNFLNSVLVDQVADLKSDIGKLKQDVLIGQMIGAVEISLANAKINNFANDLQSSVDYVNELIVNQNSQLPSLSLDTSILDEPAEEANSPTILPDATALAVNVGLEWMNALAGLNGGMTIPEYYSERNRYARHNIFWPN